MKSPLRYSKWPVIIYCLLALLFIGQANYAFFLSGGLFTLDRILWSLFGFLLFAVSGWIIAIKFTGTIFHRQVDHSIEPSKLQTLQTYWLNGETPAVFIGALDHPGTYLFHILGLNKKHDLHDAKALSFDQVSKYVSAKQEVFKK